MADPALGAKQICTNCQAKFYDLNRRPAHCPKCGTDFDPEEAVKFRRIRARSTQPDYETDEDAEDQVKAKAAEAEDEDEEEVIAPEIDEAIESDVLVTDDDDDGAEPAEPDAAPGAGIDIEDDVIEDEDDDAVPFLEEDEDDSFDDEIEGLPEEGEEEH